MYVVFYLLLDLIFRGTLHELLLLFLLCKVSAAILVCLNLLQALVHLVLDVGLQ